MATTSSFKQQCPSCEAMVPIKDTGLIGRKIDCPKCKYRFVVEDPDLGEEDEDAKDAKKGKKDNGAAAKGKKGPRRREDDDDEDEGRPKKKGSGSNKLMIGAGLALLAVIVLVVAIVFSMNGGSSTSSGPVAGGTAPTAAPTPPSQAGRPGSLPGGGEGAPAENNDAASSSKSAAPAAAAGNLVDPTNLLLNDSEAVATVRVKDFLDSTAGRALFRTPGASLTEMLQQKLGFPPEDIEQLVQCSSISQNWGFNVLRTSKPFKADTVKSAWGLKPATESPAPGQDFFLMDANNNWLDQLSRKNPALQAQLKGMQLPQRTEPFAVRIVDDQTVAFGDIPAMKLFLAVNGSPAKKSQPPAAAPATPAEGGGQQPFNAAGTPPGRGSAPGDPMSRMRGQMGRPGGQPAEDPEPKPTVSSSYLTVSPSLKTLMDRLESKQPVLSMAVDIRPVVAKLSGLPLSSLPGLPPNANLGAAKQYLDEIALVGMSVQMKDGFLVMAGAEFKTDVNARKRFDEVQKLLPILSMGLSTGLGMNIEVAPDQNPDPGQLGGAGGFNAAGGAGGMGMMGPGPMGMGPGPMGMQGRRPGGIPAGQGSRPMGGKGGFSGMGGDRPGGGEGGNAEQPGAQNSYVRADLESRILVVTVNVVLDQDAHDKLMAALQPVARQMKGAMEMANAQPRYHDLATAARTYATERKEFPRGTADRTLPTSRRGRPYPPDERVSWMADLLPYLGHAEVRRRIDVQRSWRDPENLAPATTLIPAFLDPRNPENTWYVRYPGMREATAATHFVGIAGVGLDAADYSAMDPAVVNKIGIFGYDRSTKLTDITDGVSNTMLIVQVPPSYKRPWLAGGGSTIQGVPETQSIKPFISTTHNNKRGTIAIMADGSVRFLSENTSDEVFKSLATMKGGETVGIINQVAPKIAAPEVETEMKADSPPAAAPTPTAPVEKKDAPPAPDPAPAKRAPDAGKQASRSGAADQKLLAVLSSQCGQCHTGPRAKGKAMIFSNPGTLNPEAPKEQMADALAKGKMPPKNRPRPSQDDLATLQKWLAATP